MPTSPGSRTLQSIGFRALRQRDGLVVPSPVRLALDQTVRRVVQIRAARVGDR